MREFISLRPKRYSYKVGKSEPKKCKGIKKCVVKKTITFDDYKRRLFEVEISTNLNYYSDRINMR